jgi:translation elongation factor EF-1beta
MSLTKELHFAYGLTYLNFVINVPDDSSDKLNHVTRFYMTLKCCV